MANDIKQDDTHEIKPAYQAPVLTDLDVGETATGIISGTPENSTYS
jgi:hypothetical protein